jgi:hypothetical protein
VATYTITDDKLHNEHVAEYFTRADSRITSGFRQALELFEIPLPEYAKRKPPGPRPCRGLVAALAGDYPAERPNMTTYTRKPNASPERVAAARQRSRNRLGR